MKRITDPDFVYIPAASTDIRKTFRRERKRLADLKEAQERAERESQSKVTTMKRASK